MPIYWICQAFLPTYWKHIYFFQYIGYNKRMNVYLPELSDENIKKAFGKSLKELRSHLGITQILLEEATQIPRQSLSVYERGEILPTISQAYKIARYFKLSIEDFIIYGLNAQERLLKESFRDITEKYDVVVKI